MTNPKSTQKMKCVICGRETFQPGRWCWLDSDNPKDIVHSECHTNLQIFMTPLQDQVKMLEQEVANLCKRLEQ